MERMGALAVVNTKIIWGSLILNELFDVVGVDEPPSDAVFSYKQEVMANGRARLIVAANSELNFSITVSRNTSATSSFELLKNAFNEVANKRLRIVKESGDILVEYKNAILADTKFMMGSLEDGKGVDTKITWSVSNG